MKIYKNARILTLAEKGLIESGVVVVDGAKIAGVYDVAEFDATQYPTAEVIDLGGKFVMPGLINGHHHSAMWRNYGKITAFNHDSATQALMCARLALSALRHGILAIRDLGHKGDGHMQLKECRDRGVILAPKIRGAGELIGMDWGTAPSFTNPCKTPEDVRAEVMRQAAHKSDFIKVIANNERMTHIDYEDMTCPWFTQEMMVAAVETAHMCGLKVAVHANGRTAVNWCINSGADIVEHGRCISLDMAKQMADKGMILCPTLSGQKNNATPGWGRDDIQPRYEKSWPLLVYTMENCMKAGVKMIAGTDCLGTVCQEICLLVEIGGMTPLEAIRCATINNAEVMGMDKEIGTLETGKCADFIVVDGDPLTNPACLEDNVKFFSLDGKWYDTAWLAAITPECNYWTPGF